METTTLTRPLLFGPFQVQVKLRQIINPFILALSTCIFFFHFRRLYDIRHNIIYTVEVFRTMEPVEAVDMKSKSALGVTKTVPKLLLPFLQLSNLVMGTILVHVIEKEVTSEIFTLRLPNRCTIRSLTKHGTSGMFRYGAGLFLICGFLG